MGEIALYYAIKVMVEILAFLAGLAMGPVRTHDTQQGATE